MVELTHEQRDISGVDAAQRGLGHRAVMMQRQVADYSQQHNQNALRVHTQRRL